MRGNRTAFIGTGFMARAMIGGIVGSGLRRPDEIVTVNPVDPEGAAAVTAEYGVIRGEPSDIASADAVIFAIKPQEFDNAVRMYGEYLTPDKLYLSIMAGIGTDRIENAIPGAAVVRLMPNLALSVAKSAVAYAPGRNADEDDCLLTEELFSVMGKVCRVSEDMISVVTAVSGSGPAYFCLLAEEMAKAAEEAGMDHDIAVSLAEQTLIGTAALIEKTGISAAELRRRVTSKKGTTEAALIAMTGSGFGDAVKKGVEAAKKRSDELSRS